MIQNGHKFNILKLLFSQKLTDTKMSKLTVIYSGARNSGLDSKDYIYKCIILQNEFDGKSKVQCQWNIQKYENILPWRLVERL